MLPTLLRAGEHHALAKLTLHGSVLDLGGDKGAEYYGWINGTFTPVVVNLNEKTKPDIFHDLEKPLPVQDASYDHAILMNVLEHIYDYRQLLAETKRAVKAGGTVIIVVPYLFPYHASPRDYWRFSKEALQRICDDSGLQVVAIESLGSGVFASRYAMLDRLLPLPVRLLTYLARPIVSIADVLFAKLARALGKKYDPSDYALGYCVIAEN